jgi:imidazolonepropionase-like amidohydrolase
MAQATTILCGALLTMTDQEPDGPQIIEVEANQVQRVRPARDVDLSVVNDLVDLSRYTVLPGLIDAHTHLEINVMKGNEALQVATSDAALALAAASNGASNLRRGVTTVRLVSEKNFIDLPLRRAFDSGELPGPRIVTATRGLRPSNGHSVTAVTADGVEQVTRIVRENILHGADLIKLFVTGGVATPGTDPVVSCFHKEEIAAAVAVAHLAGRPVCAHAYGGSGVDFCLDAGVDHIEHGIYMEPQQYDRIAELDRWLVGTLGVFLTEPGPAENPSWPAEVREKFLRAREATATTLAQVKRSGVKYALGTDAIHGGVCEEGIFAASAGLSNRASLEAITCNAARLCGLAGRAGVVAPGAWADLIAVEGNPLNDLRALRSVGWIMKDGQVVEPAMA